MFILCYDILHHKLSSLRKLKIRAAADDLALESLDIKVIIQAFPILDGFTVASRLGINRDKTVLLSARNPSAKHYILIKYKLKNPSWPLVTTVTSHKYLGITFGRDIQDDDLFEAPFKKALDRVKSLTPSLSRWTLREESLSLMFLLLPSSLLFSSSTWLVLGYTTSTVGWLTGWCPPSAPRLGPTHNSVPHTIS